MNPSDALREAAARVLEWWPEGSETGRQGTAKGNGFAEDIRSLRAALVAPVSVADVIEGEVVRERAFLELRLAADICEIDANEIVQKQAVRIRAAIAALRSQVVG